jgi:lipoprotein-releasing system ATP-binding protein
MFEKYTEKARRVIFFARYEASQLGCDYIEPEHLLLGLLREDKVLTAHFLSSHAALERIRKQIEDRTGVRGKVSTSVDLPLSAASKKALHEAAQEAKSSSSGILDTAHLLAGLLHDEKSFAFGLLQEHGATLTEVRKLLPLEDPLQQFDDAAPVLQCEKLKKAYPTADGELVVFSDLDLTIEKGEMVAIVGESGCGKSTLLHLLGGLDRATAGSIRYRGREISALSEVQSAEFRNRHIGFVWQIHYLLPEFTALENAMMPLLIRGMNRHNASALAKSRLEDVGLAARAFHRAGELSGGEQQRVVLARALVGDPSLLLADEPTGNLDEKTGNQIFGLIQDLHARHGLTSILVTHNLTFAARCGRVFRLENGVLLPGL